MSGSHEERKVRAVKTTQVSIGRAFHTGPRGWPGSPGPATVGPRRAGQAAAGGGLAGAAGWPSRGAALGLVGTLLVVGLTFGPDAQAALTAEQAWQVVARYWGCIQSVELDFYAAMSMPSGASREDTGHFVWRTDDSGGRLTSVQRFQIDPGIVLEETTVAGWLGGIRRWLTNAPQLNGTHRLRGGQRSDPRGSLVQRQRAEPSRLPLHVSPSGLLAQGSERPGEVCADGSR